MMFSRCSCPSCQNTHLPWFQPLMLSMEFVQSSNSLLQRVSWSGFKHSSCLATSSPDPLTSTCKVYSSFKSVTWDQLAMQAHEQASKLCLLLYWILGKQITLDEYNMFITRYDLDLPRLFFCKVFPGWVQVVDMDTACMLLK